MDLLHTRVNGDRHANGTVGGYTPAPPVDRYHPLWNVNGGPGSESALAARMGGAGVLGAGALGMGAASRLGAGGLSGLGRTAASGASSSGLSGAAGLRSGSYSGPGYGTYKAPAAGGQGSVRAARPPPRVAPQLRYLPREALVRGVLAVPVASWEEQVPVELAVRTIRRSRRVASTRPSALTMMEMNCPRAT